MSLVFAILLLSLLGAGLFAANRRNSFTPTATTITTDQIEELLPQTQCGQCGHMGCRPYAAAIAQGEAINRCPPGGNRTIKALAELLQTKSLPPDFDTPPPRSVARIREDECIGCTKCIQACPVDAIVGAAKLMHTVIVAECTGCDLCVEPCPVDCIDMLLLAPVLPALTTRSALPKLIASDRTEQAA